MGLLTWSVWSVQKLPVTGNVGFEWDCQKSDECEQAEQREIWNGWDIWGKGDGSSLRLKCDGSDAETRFRLSPKRTSPFNRRWRQFSRLLAAEVCVSEVVMLDTPRSEVVWRVLATHSIHQFPLHFPSRASPCAITFQLDSTSQQSTSQDNSWSS